MASSSPHGSIRPAVPTGTKLLEALCAALVIGCTPDPDRLTVADLCEQGQGAASWEFVVLGKPSLVTVCEGSDADSDLLCGPTCETFFGYRCPGDSNFDGIKLEGRGDLSMPSTPDAEAALDAGEDGGDDGGLDAGEGRAGDDGGAEGVRPTDALDCGDDSCAPVCDLSGFETAVATYGRELRIESRTVGGGVVLRRARLVVEGAWGVEKGSWLLEERVGCGGGCAL
jgi:hypothetical protein